MIKSTALLVLLAITYTKLFAQDLVRVQQRDLDSLSSAIAAHSQKDTLKIKLLNEYARLCFYDLDYLNGLKAVSEAKSLSKSLEYKKGELLYDKTISYFHRNNTLGAYYLILSDWRSNEGLPQSAHTGAHSHPVGIYDDDPERIHIQLFRALDSFDPEADKEIVAGIHFEIYENYKDLDSLEKSIIYWNRAYNDYENLGQVFPQVLLLTEKIEYLREKNDVDSARQLEVKAINLIDNTEDLKLKGLLFFLLGNHYHFGQGRINLTLEYYLKSADALEGFEESILYAQLMNLVGFAYSYFGNNEKAVFYFERGMKYYQVLKDSSKNIPAGLERNMVWVYTNISGSLISLNRLDEADQYLESALPLIKKFNDPMPLGQYYRYKGTLANKQGRDKEGLSYYFLALDEFKKVNNAHFISEVTLGMSQNFQRSGDFGKALQYGTMAYDYGLKTNRANSAIDASKTLAGIYEQTGQTQKANEFLKIYINLRDKNDALNAAERFEDAELRSRLESQDRDIATMEKDKLLHEQERRNQRWWIFSISGVLFSVIILALILYRNALNRKKANALLNKQKIEIENTLNQLKSTQSQLIQSEKMASLGELTAGIAHEIQNPLNFVNNFSEVSNELVDELNEELNKGDISEAKIIGNDIKQNLEKINHHGKRADAIVKGMLEHSKASTGIKEPTDINKLADEYLRLAYHGLKAKDKNFNAEIKTDFDETIGKINIVPQDIGRVLLNLINNAFYAVNEKAKQNIEGYEPIVIVGTKKLNDKVQISVKDNGNGIPDSIKEKIFQPFFTTKPTGSGTGLGLSLSYDIIKAHGGEIKVETGEGAGTEFIILLHITGP